MVANRHRFALQFLPSYVGALGVSCLTVIAATGAAQQPTPAPGALDQLRAEQAQALVLPDTPGTGRYPAIKEEVASLPDHVVYRPRDLGAVARGKLGIVVWGNGGCQDDGAGQRFHLAQIASHGYLVIANGRILSGPGFAPRPPAPRREAPASFPPPATSATQLTQAIDWAVAENRRAGSPYRGKLDPRAIAVSGWSCGGLQALQVAASDVRVKTTIIHNSGIYITASPIPRLSLSKTVLDQVRAPVLYVLGGPSDIAYANGMDDFARINRVPAMVANLGNVGHGGSFFTADGGKAARIAIDWLDWQLKHDPVAARRFRGTGCGYCQDSNWTVERKGI